MKVDILKAIKNLRYQAQHNRLTHYDELAEYQEQIADWLSDYTEILGWMINIEPDVYDDYLRYVHG